MSERLRFHLDEHMDPAIAVGLRRYGINVTTTVEAGLRTRDDDAHWAVITAERRVMVTDDADFLGAAAHRIDHPGIAYCDRNRRSIGDAIRGLVLLYEEYTAEEMVGRIEYL
jgi:predicted nuclease of predicted toxin-antitoxin system